MKPMSTLVIADTCRTFPPANSSCCITRCASCHIRDRYQRFNRSLIEGARHSGQEWLEVQRRWLTNPMDLIGTYEAASEALGNGQSRTLALAREWLDDAVETQREGREVVRQGLGDVREAVQRVQDNAPQFLRRAAERTNGQKEPVAEEAD